MIQIFNSVKIVFMGTPEFGAIVLEGILKQVAGCRLQVLAVVTEPDKPVGRKQIITPPPTKILAQKYNIPVLQPEILANYKLQITNYKPDLIVVASYGQILPKEILDIPKYGCLNVHPSLLPKYRGPSPIQTTILNGDSETGISIIKMTEKVDAGPIVAKSKIQNPESKITYIGLHNELAKLGAELLIKTIPDWIQGKIQPLPQDEAKATYTKILKKEDGRIDWKKSAEYIEKQARAFNSWPSCFCQWQIANGKLKIIKILKAGILEQTKNGPFGPPGKIFLATNEEIAVQTGKDFLIVKELQLEGKKIMSAAEFLRGHQDFIGIILK